MWDEILAAFDWLFGTSHVPGGGPPRRGKAPIPDVTGTTVAEARAVLAREGFDIEVDQVEDDPAPVMGLVVAQRPVAGTRLRRGSPVTISVLHPPARTS
jgi:beta-lactam-binding protein with PASTA domain